MIKIGIPYTGYSSARSWDGLIAHLFVDSKIGARAIDLDPVFGAGKLPKDIDVVLFDGGADVHPILYGGKYHKSISSNIRRDWNEKIIFDFYKDLPTVFAGICRGIQFLNVMMGGTLFEDLPSAKIGHKSMHDVMFLEYNKTFSNYTGIKDGEEFPVNSLHHQAIKDIADGLEPILIDSDFGVIEGVESKDGKIRAVQSHPEYGETRYAKRLEICQWLFRTKEL